MAKVDDSILRLKKMLQYIEQDGHEKAEEIDVQAEEDYYIERNRYLDQRIGAVKKYYNVLEEKYKQQIVLDVTKTKNQAYRDILSARNVAIDNVFDEVRSRITQLTSDKNACLYKKVLYQLIIQGLMKMMEPNIVIEARKKDVHLVKKVVKQAENFFYDSTGMNVRLEVNEKVFLSDECNGGIQMHTPTNSIRLDNTLDTKLKLIAFRILPHIRKLLFGANPNRKFAD